jgi:hypothetical protein
MRLSGSLPIRIPGAAEFAIQLPLNISAKQGPPYGRYFYLNNKKDMV